MKKQGGGLIVNVSSMVAKMYLPSLAAYASTKYALNAISFTARQELEKDNIRICTVSPKMTATNFGQNSIGSRPQWSSSSDGPRQEIDSAEKVAEKIAEVIKSEQAEVTL